MKHFNKVQSLIVVVGICVGVWATYIILKADRERRERVATWEQRLNNAGNFRNREIMIAQLAEKYCFDRAHETKGIESIRWGIKASNYGIKILGYLQEENDSLRKLKY